MTSRLSAFTSRVRKAYCPVCHHRVAVTRHDQFKRHAWTTDPYAPGNTCDGSWRYATK